MKKSTETEVANLFIEVIFENVKRAWPEVIESLNNLFGKEYRFKFKDKDSARLSLTLAVVALELQALKNNFPDRADRIYDKILGSISLPRGRTVVKKRIGLYQKKFTESQLQHARNNLYSPFEEVANQLMDDWFGDEVKHFYLKEYDVINPVITTVLNSVLVSLGGFWKKVKASFVITDD